MSTFTEQDKAIMDGFFDSADTRHFAEEIAGNLDRVEYYPEADQAVLFGDKSVIYFSLSFLLDGLKKSMVIH